MSNPDWPGPYWQDDASAGRRGRRADLPQDQTPWDDAGFWRADDRRAARSDDWQSGRGSRRAGRAAGSGGNGNGRGDAGRGGTHARGEDRSRRASRASQGTPGAAATGAGRFSRTADDLKNRLGLRGSALSRDRSRGGDQAADEDFWGQSQQRRPGGGDSARRGRSAAGSPDWDSEGTQGWRANGTGGNGYRGTRRAADRAGYGEDGTGEWAGRTAFRERTARFQEGVRNRTATFQRGGRGGWGGGGGWDGDGPDGEPPNWRQRFRRYVRSGDWWRHWTWKKVLGLIGGGMAAVVLLGALGIFIIYEKTPIPTANQLSANWQSSQVYFSNGKLLGTFDTVNGQSIDRQILSPNQIPTVMTQAMTAAEDRGFYSEGGISVTGLLRSAYDDVFGSGGLQGGSTITMQYAKNKYTGVDSGQNISTKLKEIFIAMKLAHQKSKQWIMTQYLNVVPFGTTIDGVGAAAEAYFNVNLAQGGKLTFEQAAALAAMPNQPGFFSVNPADGAGYNALKLRWRYVLTNMVRDGNITQQQASAAVFPKYNPPPAGNGATGYTGYLMDMVRQEMEGTYGVSLQDLNSKGYRITTTFSEGKIKALIKSVNYEKAQMRAAGTRLPYYDRIGAVLEDSKTGAIVAIYGGPGEYLPHCGGQAGCDNNNAEIPEPVGSSFKPYVLAAAVNEGMNVFTSKLNGYEPIYIPIANNATARNMLSLLKKPATYPYAPLPGGAGQTYLYELNNGSASVGPIGVAKAAAVSSDPGFTDLAHKDGIQAVINMAGALGVGRNPFMEGCYQYSTQHPTMQGMLKTCNDLDGAFSLDSQFSPTLASKAGRLAGTPGSPAIALGEGQLTAIEQASTFATFANGGTFHSPHVIARLLKNGVAIQPKIVTRRVLSPAQANDVDYALSFDNVYGTAAGSVPFRNNGGIIAKTGTLGSGANSSQAWFVGATPNQYSMAVALFTNDPAKEILNNLPGVGGLPGSQGGAWPATIWNHYFTTEWGGQPYQTVQQALPPVNSNTLFQTWIQAKPRVKKVCQPGQFKCGKCRTNFRFGQSCNGGPSPSPTTNPSPNPTCWPPSKCTSPTPTASASPTPTASTSPTAGIIGQTPAKTTAVVSSPPLTVAEETWAFVTGSLAKLERVTWVT